jgi:hypothetical protein
LPSPARVTRGNNSSFLPASAPSEQASQLAAPFGTLDLLPTTPRPFATELGASRGARASSPGPRAGILRDAGQYLELRDR